MNSLLQIDRIDHLVLTVRDIAASCDFYARVLGMRVITFADDRKALGFGQHKINLHQSRVHIDIESDDIPAEVARLENLGARVVDRLERWVVMGAPTGQRFCIVPIQRPGFPKWWRRV